MSPYWDASAVYRIAMFSGTWPALRIEAVV
jgi:hypothetical protein